MVVVQPTSIVINASESATVTCTGSGHPPPKVYWNVTGLRSNITLKVRAGQEYSVI